MFPPARILTAVDFSEPSRTALAFAARLAVQCSAELHVMHAEDPLLSAAARRRGIDLAAESREALRAFTTDTWPASQCQARFHVIEGEAVPTVLNLAHREYADIIVLGAHGMSGAGRLVFGSTAEGVLRRADLSVILVPDDWAPASPTRADHEGCGPVVCAVDLTLPSVEAASAGVKLAALLKTQARLIHVIPRLGVLDRWRDDAERATQEQMARVRPELETMLRHVASPEAPEIEVMSGSVPQCLADAAQASPHAWLVLGRALRDGGYTPPGANAYRTLALAHVPMMMHVTRP